MNRHSNAPAPRVLLLGALVCISLCWAALGFAQSSEAQHEFDIPALPLSQALQEFSKQATLQYGYIPNDPAEEKIVVHAVKGRYTVQQALAILLPEGFTFAWVNSRTISVLSPPANAPPGGVKESVTAKDQPRSEISKEQQLSMANGGGRSGSARGPYAFSWEATVEASKIFDDSGLDIATTVLDRNDIDASGVSTLADLMNYVTLQPYKTSESLLGDGTQVANLRGLGFDSTLVLINGYRTGATASSLSFNAFDLNSIPLGAVERVEIVSDSMSAIHGADAIGGVLNIVLRQDIPKPKLDIEYGVAAGGGVDRHAAFGASGSVGRARGSLVLDYFDRGPLLGRERDRFNNQDFTRFGGSDWRSTIASPGNVRATTLDNLPGLPSSFAAIPASGASLTQEDFLPTAGQQELESLYRYQSVQYERTRRGLWAQGEYAVSPTTSLYGEILYADRESETDLEPPALVNALVPRTNPYNPFDQDVMVDVLLTDLGSRTLTHDSAMTRIAGGARGQLRNWSWETSLHRSHDKDIAVRTNELDPERVAAALSASDRGEALNPFGENGRQLLTSLLAEPPRNRSETEATQATAYARGDLGTLPAGRVALTVGGEWREERVQYVVPSPVQDLKGSHERTVGAAFGELRVPIVNPATTIPAVRELSLVLSGRLDDYSDVGDIFNPEYAVLWRPLSELQVRASWSTSFRPPSLFDLYLPRFDAPVPTVDPARNGEQVLPNWRAGGNPDLKPSNADSFTTSLRYTPDALPGLRVGASYWRLHVDRTIGIPSVPQLLANEGRFADRVVRQQPSPEDAAAGLPGRLELIDITRMNNGSVRTSGIDLRAELTLETRAGRFTPSMAATWVDDFTTSDLIEGTGNNRVGIANLQGSIVRWRGVANLNWNLGSLGVYCAVRYVPAYEDVLAFGGAAERKVDSQSLIDLQISLDLGELAPPGSLWNDFEIRAGALNLFDSQPPFAEVGFLAGYDGSQADLRQRFWYLKLAKKF